MATARVRDAPEVGRPRMYFTKNADEICWRIRYGEY